MPDVDRAAREQEWCPGPVEMVDERGRHLVPCWLLLGHRGDCHAQNGWARHDCGTNRCPLFTPRGTTGCDDCGAIVGDAAVHAAWHERMSTVEANSHKPVMLNFDAEGHMVGVDP